MPLKILLAGKYAYPWYEEACARALETAGHAVRRYSWSARMSSKLGKVEEYLSVRGLASRGCVDDLVTIARTEQPDLIVLWRATHFGAGAIRKIAAAAQCPVISYNNDDPFGPAYRTSASLHQRRLWSNFIEAIPEYDLNLVFRPVNVGDYVAHGAKAVAVLPPYFVPEIHRPVALSAEEEELYGCDAVFIGHYEDDGRAAKLRALVDAGIHLRIFGNGWPEDIVRYIDARHPRPRPALGDEYAKAMGGAKLCLSFLSRLNRDVYTRRSFEIPACGRLMLSERTPELEAWFEEDKEAVYFSSAGELVRKAEEWLAGNRRETVADAALRRSWSDGHDVAGRMRQMLGLVHQQLGVSVQ